MQGDPFPYSDTIKVSKTELPAKMVWSLLSSHLTPARRQRIETVDEGQAHLEALRELAEKRAEKNAEVTELKVVNG